MGSEINVEISCCLCSEEFEVKINTPDGWETRYCYLPSDDGFCPKHSKVAEFAESQCSGCVGGWGECDLWKSFAYRECRSLSEADLATIEKGICPKRTNGTFLSSASGVSELRLDKEASSKAGLAFAMAIREYWELYP